MKNGMFIFRAKELCRELIYVPYNFDEYRNVSQTFYEILSSFTCNIEAVSCDEALLDMSDLVENGRFIILLQKSSYCNKIPALIRCSLSIEPQTWLHNAKIEWLDFVVLGYHSFIASHYTKKVPPVNLVFFSVTTIQLSVQSNAWPASKS